MWVKNDQEWQQNTGINTGHFLGHSTWNRAQRSLSLLPRLSSMHEHRAVAWSCPIHGLTGFTPCIYAKWGNFSTSEGNNLPVKSEPELSPATKPDFKLSLNWQVWLPDTRQEAGWVLDFTRKDFGMIQKKQSPPLTRMQHSKWCASEHSWPSWLHWNPRPTCHPSQPPGPLLQGCSPVFCSPVCVYIQSCPIPGGESSTCPSYGWWMPSPLMCLCLSAFEGHNSSSQFSVVNVLPFLSTASNYKDFSSMV